MSENFPGPDAKERVQKPKEESPLSIVLDKKSQDITADDLFVIYNAFQFLNEATELDLKSKETYREILSFHKNYIKERLCTIPSAQRILRILKPEYEPIEIHDSLLYLSDELYLKDIDPHSPNTTFDKYHGLLPVQDETIALLKKITTIDGYLRIIARQYSFIYENTNNEICGDYESESVLLFSEIVKTSPQVLLGKQPLNLEQSSKHLFFYILSQVNPEFKNRISAMRIAYQKSLDSLKDFVELGLNTDNVIEVYDNNDDQDDEDSDDFDFIEGIGQYCTELDPAETEEIRGVISRHYTDYLEMGTPLGLSAYDHAKAILEKGFILPEEQVFLDKYARSDMDNYQDLYVEYIFQRMRTIPINFSTNITESEREFMISTEMKYPQLYKTVITLLNDYDKYVHVSKSVSPEKKSELFYYFKGGKELTEYTLNKLFSVPNKVLFE